MYGHDLPSNYEEVSFRYKAKKKFSMTLPKMHLVAMNRSTTYHKKPAKAFNKVYDDIKDRVRKQRNSLPNDFTRTDGEVFINMPDAHTVAIVASYQGIPIQKLRSGKKYLTKEKGEKPSQVNQPSLMRYQQAIRRLVDLL